MKIGADIRVLMDKQYSGVSEYTGQLLSAILRQDKLNNYKLFYNSWRDLGGRLDAWQGQNSQIVGTHIPNKIFNYLLQRLPRYPKIDKILGGVDLFWLPHFNLTSLSDSSSGLKKVATVYDLAFLRYPEFFNLRKRFWHDSIGIKKVWRQADALVAISEHTKRDLTELVGIAPEKISVIYPGNSISRRDIGVEERRLFLQKHGLVRSDGTALPFILFVGNIEPRKNLQGLIEAFNILRSANPPDANRENEVRLVLAGADGWKNGKIRRAWRRSPYRDDMKFLGYVSQAEKEILYASAAVLAYPSFYEGFGFPPLEAMTYGLPVVCSNVSSLPEVVGDAALMINPFRPEEIAAALALAIADDGLRAHLIAKGHERAKPFSWDKAAGEYIRLFQKVCGQ